VCHFERVVLGCFFEAKLKSFAGYVTKRKEKEQKVRCFCLPLNRKVTFQGVLEKNNNIHVPKLIR